MEDQKEDARDAHELVAATNAHLDALVASLPDDEDPAFWPTLAARDELLPPEVLVRVLQGFRAQGRMADVDRVMAELIPRAYGIATDVVARTLRSRPQDREDAIGDALETMWRRLLQGDTFWERNFAGALKAACITACRSALAKKRAHTPFAELRQPEGGIEYDERFADTSTAAAAAAVQIRVSYDRAVGALKPEVRQAWRLHVEEELTLDQVARQLGCVEKTVRNRLKVARQMLIEMLTKEGIDVP